MAEKGIRCAACGAEFQSQERLQEHAQKEHRHAPAQKEERKG